MGVSKFCGWWFQAMSFENPSLDTTRREVSGGLGAKSREISADRGPSSRISLAQQPGTK